MKVIQLSESHHLYNSSVCYILGELHTLVDVGSDPNIVHAINKFDTGNRKKRVDQVILTHFQPDHITALVAIRRAFNPKVVAFSPSVEGVDHVVKNGDYLWIGDHILKVVQTSRNSGGSISLYSPEDDVLLVGKATVVMRVIGRGYEEDFEGAVEENPILHHYDNYPDSVNLVRSGRNFNSLSVDG